MILSARPDLIGKPKMVRDMFLATARRPNHASTSVLPNNAYGYGIVNATALYYYNLTSVVNECPDDCNNRGVCVNRECECFDTYYGTTCSFNATQCHSDTCKFGFCKSDKCECFSGFKGATCAEKSSAMSLVANFALYILLLASIVIMIM